MSNIAKKLKSLQHKLSKKDLKLIDKMKRTELRKLRSEGRGK